MIKVQFARIQGGCADGRNTSQSRYYKIGRKEALNKIKNLNSIHPFLTMDPFARNCDWATHRNDIDPKTKANYNLDALEFMKSMDAQRFDIVFFDPPFSSSQELKYEYNSNLYSADSNKISMLYKECFRVLKVGGVMLKLGYNSTRPHPGFELSNIWVVNFGGSRNDVIMSLWIKKQSTLF